MAAGCSAAGIPILVADGRDTAAWTIAAGIMVAAHVERVECPAEISREGSSHAGIRTPVETVGQARAGPEALE